MDIPSLKDPRCGTIGKHNRGRCHARRCHSRRRGGERLAGRPPNGAAARQPGQTTGRGRVLDPGGRNVRASILGFGIVRLMFMMQSSGMSRADDESNSRAMLYAARGMGAR
ncbi:hypothetical protein MMARJ_09980 [Mycobacterium marseillense]|uniref:Uncharacterized protein n=1 Tax=Mycobacterium marseillense TaxID=701042 RepID=A0ABN5ZQ50_9MYCO|nr:hypothetical protein MMARJ_09980 [Mycobacterium marseillense]